MNAWLRSGLLLGLLVGSAWGAETLVGDAPALEAALKAARPGDVIVLRDGEWRDLDLVIDFDAAAEAPLTVRAQTPGRVVLTGASRARLGGSHLVLQGLLFRDGIMRQQHVIAFRVDSDRPARHSRVADCAVINYRPAPERDGSTTYLSLYGADNRVDHCYFRGKIDEGPMLVVWVEDEPNGHLIDRNHFAGRSPLGRNGGETIRVGTSQVSMNDSRTIVEHNYFEDCDGEAEIISNKSCENVYRYNTFVSCRGALVLRHGNRCLVEGNWFFGHGRPGTGGIRVIGEDHRIVNNYLDGLAGRDFESALPIVNGIPGSALNEYFRVRRAVIAFNTLVDCAQSITFGVGAGRRNRVEPPADCVLANNLVLGASGPLVRFDDRPLNTVWIGNQMGGAEVGLEDEGIAPASGIDFAAPRRGPLTIPPGSSPIGAAMGEFDFVVDDIAGRPRVGARDVGCMQASSPAEPRRRPLTPADVGPSWPPPALPMPTTRPGGSP